MDKILCSFPNMNNLQLVILLFLAAATFSKSDTGAESASRVRLTQTADQDQDFILNGINTIRCGGSVGILSVFGPTAFSLAAGLGASQNVVPIAAGGRYGRGKMAGFGQDSCVAIDDPSRYSNIPSDHNKFLMNLYKWLAGGNVPKNVAFFGGNDADYKFLRQNGVASVTIFRDYDMPRMSFKSLAVYDVVIIYSFITPEFVPVLQQYVDNGGGLAVFFTAWWFGRNDVDLGAFATNYHYNKLARNFGFVWTRDNDDLYASSSLPGSTWNVSKRFLADSTLQSAWDKVKGEMVQFTNYDMSSKKIEAFGRYAAKSPNADFLNPIMNWYDDAVKFTRPETQPVPTFARPVVNPIDKFKLRLFDILTKTVVAPQDIKAHPSSGSFPGNVAVPFDIPTEFNRTLSFNKPRDTWMSTGLYALPGRPLVVKVEGLPASQSMSLMLQIGCHIGDIGSYETLQRAPYILRRTRFYDGTAVLNSPYGGSVYVISTDNAQVGLKPLTFTFNGAVPAPYFKLGETTLQDWQMVNRIAPAPWAELATEKVILTVSSNDIRKLDDPETLLKAWDVGLGAIQELLGKPRDLPRPERLVADLQLKTGVGLHSGYPSVGHLYHGTTAVNVTEIKTSENWGWWHELGHNNQDRMWTFKGTGEVTNNVIGIYVFNAYGLTDTEKMHPELQRKNYMPKIQDYIKRNVPFSVWKDDPWLALQYYLQLQRAFGWDAFKNTFAVYNTLPENQRPGGNDDQAKMDTWILLFSKSVKQDLYDFHKSWGFPITDGVKAQLSEYPPSKLRITDLL